MITAKNITEFLNQELNIHDIEDSSWNGLQVENEGEITKIGFAVDACLESFQKASEAGCQMLITHHGMIWDKSKPVKGNHYKRIKLLFEKNLAIYGVHLPLDRHDKYGNNIVLAKLLELKEIKPFGYYGEKTIGFYGLTNTNLEEIKKKLSDNGMKPDCFCHGNNEIKKVAIVSGSFDAGAYQAIALKADLYLTGEKKYNYHHLSKENNFNIICGGHYATEVWGVKALMPLLKEKFNVEVEFIDNPVEM
jgi:dinuclear metal center YbgI/SA1388 family protein